LPEANPVFVAGKLDDQIKAKGAAVVDRNRPAYTRAFLERLSQATPIVLSALHVNQISLLHLPAESFIEYQLAAQKLQPDRFVATAAYGDGGPWYIPTAEAYPQGGYETSVAFCDASVERMLLGGITKLLDPNQKQRQGDTVRG
jgi:hypothetical protein